MKKNLLRRLGLGALQHVIAMGILVSLATILFHSYLTVQTMDGPTTYALAPLETEPEFEDSKLFRDIFQTGTADITRLVVIKEQLETGGQFDPSKLIDVTEYANRKGAGNNCPVTVVYELEDLIKWGKYGVEYTSRAMSMSDFVNYFGPATSPDNFALDANGALYFAGFYDEEFAPAVKRYYSKGAISDESLTAESQAEQEERLQAVKQAMSSYTEAQLEDMAFSYILGAIPANSVEVSREDDGTLTVYFSMINGRYETVDREKRVAAYAGNWIEYMQLQSNIAEAVNGLSASYILYQNCNTLYQTNSNLKYVVRVVTDDGVMRSYTNQEEIGSLSDEAITDYYAEYRRYLIYYPDSLEFSGNTGLTETDIHGYLNEYDYAYPEKTHIWIGVDTTYEVTGDAFYSAHVLFEKIVPRIKFIVVILALLIAFWLLITTYLTVTDGVAIDSEGNQTYYLNAFDRIWTELLALGFVGFWLGANYGAGYLQTILNTVYEHHSLRTLGVTGAQTYEYAAFALYGGAVSFCFCVLWYSLVRRIKQASLWRDSMLHWILIMLERGLQFVLSHQNVAVSTLLPYNVFLVLNLAGVLGCVRLWKEQRIWAAAIIAGLVILDGVIGVFLFKANGERMDIFNAIKRIRDG
ncbi:MAG: hypothetical protein IJ747_02585 [Lachnospiraceae bacterium]|nr:hypothetical protein [Lachnospiraceae bacterium]